MHIYLLTSMLFSYLLLTAFFGIAVGLDLPPYIKRCKTNEDLSKCLKENIEAAKPHFLDGIPELYIPPLKPLHMTNLKMETGQLTFIAQVFDLSGINDFDLKEIDLNLDECTIKLRAFFPFLEATGFYTMKGRIILLNLEGSGNAYANISNLEGFLSMKGVKESKDGKQFINFKDSEIDLKINGPSYLYFGNLFGPREDLTKTLTQVINENNSGFMEELNPFIKLATMAVFRRTIKLIFTRNSIDDLFSS